MSYEQIPLRPRQRTVTSKAEALQRIWVGDEEVYPLSQMLAAFRFFAEFFVLPFAALAAQTYLPIGESFLTALLKRFRENPDQFWVPPIAGYLGVSALITNVIFNTWAVDSYFAEHFSSTTRERAFIRKQSRSLWRLVLTHGEALFASIAMFYVSFRENGEKLDFWDVNTFFIGIFISYLSLNVTVDAALWLIRSMIEYYKPNKKNQIAKAIQKYFSILHRYHRNTDFKRYSKGEILKFISDGYTESRASFWKDWAPYVLGGLPFILLLAPSRWGLICSGIKGAEYLTRWVPSPLDVSGRVAVGFLAAFPPVAYGLTSFGKIGTAIYRLLFDRENIQPSYAFKFHFYPTSLLLEVLLPFVLASFSGNADLVMQYSTNFPDVVWTVLFISSLFAIPNIFGIFSFVVSMMEKFTRSFRWFGHKESCEYAKNENFFCDYENLLKLALTNDSDAIKLMICMPGLTEEVQKILGKDKLRRMAKEVSFTEEEIADIKAHAEINDEGLQELQGRIGFKITNDVIPVSEIADTLDAIQINEVQLSYLKRNLDRTSVNNSILVTELASILAGMDVNHSRLKELTSHRCAVNKDELLTHFSDPERGSHISETSSRPCSAAPDSKHDSNSSSPRYNRATGTNASRLALFSIFTKCFKTKRPPTESGYALPDYGTNSKSPLPLVLDTAPRV